AELGKRSGRESLTWSVLYADRTDLWEPEPGRACAGQMKQKLRRAEEQMRTQIVLAVALGIEAPALMAQEKITPLNVKTGLWQSTTTIAISGSMGIPPEMEAKLTPEQRARMEAAMKQSGTGQPHTTTNKGCIKQE